MGRAAGLCDLNGACLEIQGAFIAILLILQCLRQDLQGLNIGILLLLGLEFQGPLLHGFLPVFDLIDFLGKAGKVIDKTILLQPILLQSLRIHTGLHFEYLRQNLLSIHILLRLGDGDLRCKGDGRG